MFSIPVLSTSTFHIHRFTGYHNVTSSFGKVQLPRATSYRCIQPAEALFLDPDVATPSVSAPVSGEEDNQLAYQAPPVSIAKSR